MGGMKEGMDRLKEYMCVDEKKGGSGGKGKDRK